MTTETDHMPITILVGSGDCLERECEEYVTENGDDNGIDRCSHVREETVCEQCSDEPDEYGFYNRAVACAAIASGTTDDVPGVPQ